MTGVFGVVAIVVFAVSAAQAWYLPSTEYLAPPYPVVGYDASFFALSWNSEPNIDTGTSDNGNTLANWNNPYSTYDGAIRINSGSGPVMLTAAVNADLWVDDTDNSWGPTGNGSGGANGWVEEVRLLNSDGSAANDFSTNGPGVFNGPAAGLGVPGTYWNAYDNRGGKSKGYGSDTTFQFQLQLWTGTETTYAAALADGEYTADASWAQTVNPAQYGVIPPTIPGEIDNPAMIMEDLPGDAASEGKVDINDLTIVLTNYGLSGSPLDVTYSEGDFTGDGMVDINDLTIVLAHYGNTIGSSPAGMAAVPEPSILVLAAAGLAGLLACACRSRETRCVEREGG
jgi:hypothetical protein